MGEEEEEGATKDKRTNGSRTKTQPKRLSYIKFRADIKNQRRKCCIRDAPKIRQKNGEESGACYKMYLAVLWICDRVFDADLGNGICIS